jgi:hypothetical protein
MPEFSAVPFFRQIPAATVDERLDVGLVDRIAAGGAAWIYPVGLGAYRGAWWGDGARPGEPRLLERIPASTLARLRAPNAYLLLDFSEEGLTADPAGWTGGLLGYLRAAAPPLGLSPRRILVLVGSRAPVPAEAIGGIRVINHEYALVQAGFAYGPARADPARFVQAAAVEAAFARRALRPKRFLCLNGTLRLHRLCVVLHLLRSGTLDRGLVSFPDCAPDLLARLQSTGPGELAPTRPPASDLLRTPPTDLLRRLPLTVDIRPRLGAGGQPQRLVIDPWHTTAAWPYAQSYLSVVTESEFDQGARRRFTEKTWKPVVNYHPMLMVGSPGSLAALRRLGFETFAPLVDERYDEIEDPNARLAAVLRELDRLARRERDELARDYHAIWPALVHNHARLFALETIERHRLITALEAAVTAPGPCE